MAESKTIHGRDVNVLVDVGGTDIYIGCATSSVFRFRNEIIGKTDVNAGLFRKKRVRISDMSASVSGVSITEGGDKVGQFYFLQEGVRRTEQNLKFLFVDEDGVDTVLEMVGLVESIEINSDVSNFSEYDINFEGTGPFTISELAPPDSGEVSCETQDTIYTTLAEGAISIQNPLLIQASGQTITIISVSRSGAVFYETTAPAGNLEFNYNSTTGEISFLNAGNPAGGGFDLEPVSVEYKIET